MQLEPRRPYFDLKDSAGLEVPGLDGNSGTVDTSRAGSSGVGVVSSSGTGRSMLNVETRPSCRANELHARKRSRASAAADAHAVRVNSESVGPFATYVR